jgi:hypothetical protein
MKRALLAAACFVIVAAATAANAQEKLTYLDLVKRLTDLERLAVLPAPGDTCAQWSSYDRASKYDEAAGKYEKWDANRDGIGIMREEGDLVVMAEMEGPGCIWRIWSARALAGHVKIYLDGAAEPAVDLPFAGYFDGKTPPFVYPSLVNMTARGLNNYVPIPYQKSCKIVAEKGWGNYYHFGYETFPKGTVVPTFKMALSDRETAYLKMADAFFTNTLSGDPAACSDGQRSGCIVENRYVMVNPGRAETLVRLEGERAITAIRVKLSPAASREEEIAVLRELALRITWDGEKAPAVWAPLGDFFGTAPGVNKYKSLPLGMTDDGFYSFWYMPFAKGALVELVNDGAVQRRVDFQISHAPLTRPVAGLGRFHAKWHRDAFLPAEPERKIDWTMLKTAGRGRFCGVMLHIWNPKGGWWGEGDEKFFVDGEKFPSTIGTGSEDYFGYAWGCAEFFQNAYHDQTLVKNNRGHVSVNRWHITDNVPFQKSFEGCIEKYFPNSKPTLYACTTYWYLAPGGTDPYEPQPMTERIGYWAEPPAPAAVKGAIEGEAMDILGKTGDRLFLAIPVKDAGKYRLVAQLTKAKDYGVVQLYLDDAKVGAPVDCYSPTVVPSGELDFGTHVLTAGRHKLTVEIAGANEKAAKSYMAGIDYVRLEPAN